MKWVYVIFVFTILVCVYTWSKLSKTETILIDPPVIEASQDQQMTQDSSDGLKKLLLIQNSMSGILFQVTDNQSQVNEIVFQEATASGVYEIPENSWSPDNKQFMVLKTGSDGRHYRVFKANGTNFTNDQKYLDVNDYWSKTKNNLRINEITGWAGDDLLIVTTIKSDGAAGQSYWFVTSSRSFLQLSR